MSMFFFNQSLSRSNTKEILESTKNITKRLKNGNNDAERKNVDVKIAKESTPGKKTSDQNLVEVIY